MNHVIVQDEGTPYSSLMAETAFPTDISTVLSARQILDAITDGVIITNSAGIIEYVNPAFCKVTGYSMSEAIGNNPKILQSGRHPPSFYKRMWQAIASDGHWQGEIWNRRKNGQVYVEWLSVSTVLNSDGQATHFLGVFSDISARKRAEDAIRRKAFQDGLTGLPNRGVFLQQVKQTLARAKRRRSLFAVLFIDLDHVKLINDSLGHATGDQVLREAALRLRGAIRDADTVSRFGGDEFVVLLGDLSEESDAVRIGRKILEVLRDPIKAGETELRLTASVGLCVYPGGGQDVEALVNNADAAMYRAKTEGRDRLCQFP